MVIHERDLYINPGTMLATSAARLSMQSDGNLALYDETGRGRWATGTYDHPGAYAGFQRDGSLGVYWEGRVLFATATSGRGAYLALRRDGNLVIYDYENNPIWAVLRLDLRWVSAAADRLHSAARCRCSIGGERRSASGSWSGHFPPSMWPCSSAM